nr:hypothetical protein Iba_chr06bCG18310 [Ipomoea batatas]
MAKHLCIHKGHGRDAFGRFGEVKRYLPSSKAKDNTKSFRVKLRLKSLVDWEKIQREADRVNEGKVKKDDAKLQTFSLLLGKSGHRNSSSVEHEQILQ